MVRAALIFFALMVAMARDVHAQTDFAVTTDVAAIAEANNQFTLDLYKSVCDTPGNLFLSPYSVSTALAMLHAGAVGPTADEIGKTLHLPNLPPTELHSTFGDLIGHLQADKSSSGYELHVANAAWTGSDVPINKDYLNLVEQHFSAHIANLDFYQPDSVASTINDWVADHTNDKIKDLISPDAIRSDSEHRTALVLTNAIYFKGDWQLQFETNRTHDDEWHGASGETSSVPMMHQTGEYGFFEGENLSAIEMPYIGGNVTMVVLLPNKDDGLPDVEKSLDFHQLDDIISRLRDDEVIVSCPKFKVESQFLLNDSLKQLGMPLAFTRQADFSQITVSGKMLVSAVFHRAFVKVDEEGTEAAAATGIVGVQPTVVVRKPVFNADHPFLFLIRDIKTKTILFIGRIEKPAP